MIELKNLSFSYEDRTIFRRISASFEKGVFYGILGANGCGKTTLIRLLCALEKPKEGKILLNGKEYSTYSSMELARQVSLLPQSRELPSVSVEELVSRGRYPYLGLTKRFSSEDRAAVKDALRKAKIQNLAHRNVSTLSGGERQRVCMGLVLAQNTPVVLLDEPTTYLDISHRMGLAEELQSLRGEGKCVIAVLHDLSLALKYCDRLLVLGDGGICGEGTPSEILSQGVLEQTFSLRCIPVTTDGITDYVFHSLR